MNDYESVLSSLGYDLINENSSYWRAKPLYRDSDNASVLRISKATGSWKDFAENTKGCFNLLVKRTLGFATIDQADKWISERGFTAVAIERKPRIHIPKKIESKYFEGLMPNYSFYVNDSKGIELETIKNFECGVCFSGKQNNRLVFVIRDEDGEVIGVSGRNLYGERVKWKNMGDKRRWFYPLCSLEYIQKKRSLILVESIGDMLALYNAGIKNVMVVFGVEISPRLINFIATLDIDVIHVSTNNDLSKEKNWGLRGATEIKKKLSRLIDEKKIRITLPPDGDWGDMKKDEIINYVKKIQTGK